MTKFKVGDIIVYEGHTECVYVGEYDGRYTAEHILNTSGGWFRNGTIPPRYKSKYSNTYWYIEEGEDWKLVEEQPTYKFKVGDRVRKINNDRWFKRGEILTIVSGQDNCWRCSNSEEQWYQGNDELELVKEESLLGACGNGSVGEDLSIKKQTIMSILTTFVKNSLLSADEKALRQVGLKTDCGEYTQEAIDLVLQELCKEKEARLIEVANGLLAEDKKNK